MKVLFAVSNDAVSESIIKKYQQMYKEIIVGKNVYYFNAILKELQKDKTYDRVVISEDLEPFTNNNYDMIDNFIFERLDNISDEATTTAGEDIPIILIATDRRTKSDSLLIKLFGIGVYSALLGQDRSIDEVCKLINKPRTKKEAKVYYKVDSNEVEYKPENEEDVSEQEIQNILAHYKKLGKNEDRYVESFDNIASQYTDSQLKVIIKFLPLNVKAVLEANSPRYQQLTSFGGSKKRIAPTKFKNSTEDAISNNGIKIESIGNSEKKLTKPVIIPSMTKKKEQPKPVEKVETFEEIPSVPGIVEQEDDVLQKLEQIDEKLEQNIEVEAPKRGRGRPKKVREEIDEDVVQAPKRGRGRPRKNPVAEEVTLPQVEEEDDDFLPGFDQIDTLEPKNLLSDFDDEYDEKEDVEEAVLPQVEEENEDEVLQGFEDFEDYQQEPEQEQETEVEPYTENIEDELNFNDDMYQDIEENNIEKRVQSYEASSSSLQNLMTKDKKVVAFVGTTKNGTSFLVNNLADLLSKQGIKTAILDLTKNRNSYYIYTKNEEQLRKIAYSCTEKLIQGEAQGIKVNTYLDVYTSLPGENNDIEEYQRILETLVSNYSLVLLDCDFHTEYGYLKEAQEIYLVQSMDVLTIQPLTAYLRDLKAKQVLDPNKLRIVINKYTRVKGVTEKVIVGGMAFYNDPAMSFMTELFNRETVKYCVVPFDNNVYSRYLEGLINCNISVNGYQKEFIGYLRKLSNMVYPLIGNVTNQNREKYGDPRYNKYAATSNSGSFTNEMNSTLDKMKRNY